MNNKFYVIVIIFLGILSICGIYNFFTPIQSLNSKDRIIIEGTIIKISKEYEYSENSEYIEKYVAEVLNKNKDEQVSINLKNDEISKYKEKDKVNFYENKGEYYITEEPTTPTNGGIGWLILSIVEILIIVFIVIKKFKN